MKEEDQGDQVYSQGAMHGNDLQQHGYNTTITDNITHQEQHLLMHQSTHASSSDHHPNIDHNINIFYGGGINTMNRVSTSQSPLPLLFPHETSPIMPWPSLPQSFDNTLILNPAHFNPPRLDHLDPFLPPSHPPSYYAGLFNRRSAYDNTGPSNTDHHHLRIITDALGPVLNQTGGVPFGLQAELNKMTAQEIMDAKALAASKSHSEAERRRRERINNHLAKLRSLLPSTTKTDKASLLAEVIQHVKELKRQTSIIAETSPIPTEIDELSVDASDELDGKLVIKASLCCEDRSDLLPDLIKTLKALRLRTIKTEITTLGGRVRNVLFITGEDQDWSTLNVCNENENHLQHSQQPSPSYCISSIQEALKAVMDKNGGDESSSGSVKRQRTNVNNIINEQQQQQQHRSL